MIDRLRRGGIACCLAAALAVAGASARAVEAGPGTKNFNVPAGVPDHFSNEAEPFAASPAAEGPVPRGGVSRGPRAHRAVATRGHDRHGHHARVTRHAAVRGHSRHAARSSHVSRSHTASHHTPAGRTAARPHTASAGKRRG